MSLRMRLLNLGLRLVARRWAGEVREPEEARRDMRRAAGWMFRPAPLTLALPIVLGGRAALSVRSRRVEDRAARLLYLHGGGQVAGSPRTHVALMSWLARDARVEVIAPEFRLAPEHPCPAGLEDAEAAWNALIAQGTPPEKIVLAGDSAGGGLALALLSRLCASGTPPAGLVAFSPWVDLTGASPSIKQNARRDAMLVAERVPEVASYYLGGKAASDPEASPIFAQFPGCPPVLLHCSESEILRDDSLRMADHLRGFGAEVTVQSWPDAPHVWHMFVGYVPEARAALRAAGQVVRAMLNAGPPRQ